MKKIISYFLIFTMIFKISTLPVFAYETEDSLKGMDYVAKRLSVFTKEDRKNLETIFIPLVITDSGLDTLKKTISEYSEDSETFMHVMLKKLLVRVDKEELLNAVSYLYLIDETDRNEYIGGYYERKSITLNTEQKNAINEIFRLVFVKYPELETVFEQDEITPEVAARLFCMFSKMNNAIPLFKESDTGQLEVNIISSALQNKIRKYISPYADYEKVRSFFESVCDKMNEKYSSKELKNFIVAGAACGIVKKMPQAVNDGNGSVSAVSKPDSESKNVYSAKIVRAANDVFLEVSGKDEFGKDLKESALPFYITFYYEEYGYLTDLNSNVVKMCICEGGVWHAVLNKIGTYKIVASKAEGFKDVDGWGKECIYALYERKIINGLGDNMFCPDNNITREEFITLLVQMFELEGDYGNEFDDVDANAWYYEYVSAAKYHGLVDGYGNGKFGVGEPITRQDMSKILYSVIVKFGIDIDDSAITTQFYDKNLIADYAYDAVMALKRAKIVNGDEKGCFNPMANATRRETATSIYNILSEYVKG